MSELFKWLKKTEAEKRRIPVVETLDRAPRPEEISGQHSSLKEVTPIPSQVPSRLSFNLELADPRIKTVLDPRTLPGEQFRFLRARLGQFQRQRGVKSLLITSSLPGEGKTLTACCLAGILAQEPGKRVLLVDADMRMPRAAQSLGLFDKEGPAGLAQVLRGDLSVDETMLRASSMDFFLLPAGEVPANPAELLASDNLERALLRMTELFDWIVFDSPPVLTVADASRLAPLCDTVVMVAQANKTSAKLIQKAIQQIGKEQICGVVMNRVRNLHSSTYYYGYYGGSRHAK